MEQQLLEEVERVMRQKGVSQAEYARQKDKSRQHINLYIKGKKPLLTSTGTELLEYLGVRIRLEVIEEEKP